MLFQKDAAAQVIIPPPHFENGLSTFEALGHSRDLTFLGLEIPCIELCMSGEKMALGASVYGTLSVINKPTAFFSTLALAVGKEIESVQSASNRAVALGIPVEYVYVDIGMDVLETMTVPLFDVIIDEFGFKGFVISTVSSIALQLLTGNRRDLR